MVELVDEKAGPEGEIMVSRAGSGPALVLIHGITSGRWTWGSVVDRLAEDYELFIYDQRGHGQSQKPNHGYQLTDYAGDLDIVLDHFGIARPLIIGHSLGGMVTLEWAIGQPDRAKAIVIEDSPMRRGGDETGELFDGWIALNKGNCDLCTIGPKPLCIGCAFQRFVGIKCGRVRWIDLDRMEAHLFQQIVGNRRFNTKLYF